jgi:hypothetical protein
LMIVLLRVAGRGRHAAPPIPGLLPYRRSETATAALVLPDSGYLSWKMCADAVTCPFGPRTPQMGRR